MSKSAQFEVLGGERIGDKAAMLLEHEPIIREVGLEIPDTTVIACEAIAGLTYFLGDKDVVPGRDPSYPNLGPFIRRAMDRNSDVPVLAIRSSAEGDARGTGIYESTFARNRRKDLGKAVGKVVASFNSEGAWSFRNQAQLGWDFAVMIQPLVGQYLNYEGDFGPTLSGFGYSSMPRFPDGYLNIVPGLGGGVSRSGGEVITPITIQETVYSEHFFGATFSRLVDEMNHDPVSTQDSVALETYLSVRYLDRNMGESVAPSDLIVERYEFGLDEFSWLEGQTIQCNSGGVKQRRAVLYTRLFKDRGINEAEVTESPLSTAIRRFKPQDLIDRLARMEQIAGYPLYIEWASVVEGDDFKPVILQIAPVEQKELSPLDSLKFVREFYRGNNVTGNGEIRSNKIVLCYNAGDIEHLKKFNKDPANKGYILVYSSRLTTSLLDHIGALGWSDCSNASAILEIPDAPHGNARPIDHLRGAIDLTGKVFGVIDRAYYEKNGDSLEHLDMTSEDWQSPEVNDNGYGRLRINVGEFAVLADEQADRFFLGQTH